MLSIVPIREIEEERVRMAPVDTVWGIFCCLTTSRQGGWIALSKTQDIPTVRVVELGK